jgi:uncharacterized protein (TIGR00369 family)
MTGTPSSATEGGEQRLRERVVRWADPRVLASASRTMSGRAFLEAISRGDLPAPSFSQLVQLRFEEIGDGQVRCALEPDESHYNPNGSVHGGIIATVLDTVMGCAVHSRLPAGRGYTTLEIKVNYVRAVTVSAGILQATGNLLHLGRQTGIAEGRITDAAGRLCAHASTTCLVFDLPPER